MAQQLWLFNSIQHYMYIHFHTE